MSIFFPRPASIPKLPNPVPPDSALAGILEISPEFLVSLPQGAGGVEFSFRDRLHLLITDPAEVHELLVTKADDYLKGDEEIALSQAVGWGLIGLEGRVHKHAQKTASPALRVDALNNYVATIQDVAHKHIGVLLKSEVMPMRYTLRCLAQEAAERSLFSSSADEIDYTYQDHVFNLNNVLFSPDLKASAPEKTSQLIRSYSASRQGVMEHVTKLIENWRDDPSTGTFLIDYLSNGHEITADNFGEFHQQVSVFLQAATETTAALASWAVMLLSDNPDYWRKLREEVDAAGDLSSYEAILNLKLLDGVINEALRLYPPAWVIPRIARVDTRVGSRKVLEGTRVIASPYVSHRMSGYFENAEKFKPERWDLEAESLPRGLFFPFGMGNRICIGERYGKLTAKIILLAALKQGSSFQSDHNQLSIDSHSLLLNPSPEVLFKAKDLA